MIRTDLLGDEERDGLRHRQVRFPGTGRPDAEHDVVLFDRFEVAPLCDRLRRNLRRPAAVRLPFRK